MGLDVFFLSMRFYMVSFVRYYLQVVPCMIPCVYLLRPGERTRVYIFSQFRMAEI